jgi:hypothetical protein
MRTFCEHKKALWERREAERMVTLMKGNYVKKILKCRQAYKKNGCRK